MFTFFSIKSLPIFLVLLHLLVADKKRARVMKKTFSILITMILILTVTRVLPSQKFVTQQPTVWHIGVARVDVTPTDSLWMAGYAARDHAAEGTLHPLWAKAMVFQDDNGNKGVIVTTDLLGFPKNISDTIKKKCREEYNLAKSQIILSSSHTHTGPVLREGLYDIYDLSELQIEKIDQYSERLEKQIVDLVGQALENVQPAVLLANNGVVRFQVNRRNNSSSTLSSQSDLNGPNDYAVPILRAQTEGGHLAAVLFGYACHPTVLSSYYWSGDYPGFAQLELEEKLAGTMALFFQGCGADQNPLPRRTVGLAKQYGLELAAAVQNVVTNSADTLDSELQMAYEEIELELSQTPNTQSLQKLAEKKNGYQQRWAKRMLKRIKNGESIETSYPYPIQVWRMGQQAIFVLGGEVVIDYAIQLKRIFGENTFVMGYANDVMGYIPSVRVLREGGYEGLTSQIVYGLSAAWTADIENKIIHQCIKLAGEIGIKMPEAELVTK
jgi:neutral ceramidase